MLNENDVIMPSNAIELNIIALALKEKLEELFDDISLVEFPSQMGDLIYADHIVQFEYNNIIKPVSLLYEPVGWRGIKIWGENNTDGGVLNYQTFSYQDWNRWYTNMHLLLSINDIGELYNFKSSEYDRYESEWDGNASLEWEE